MVYKILQEWELEVKVGLKEVRRREKKKIKTGTGVIRGSKDKYLFRGRGSWSRREMTRGYIKENEDERIIKIY